VQAAAFRPRHARSQQVVPEAVVRVLAEQARGALVLEVQEQAQVSERVQARGAQEEWERVLARVWVLAVVAQWVARERVLAVQAEAVG
jgi:hypothetical protein